MIIYRIEVPQHNNQFIKQVYSYYHYQRNVWKIVRDINISFLFVSTSKLFSGYLAYRISKAKKIPYYLDLRDLFAENLKELIRLPLINDLISFIVKQFFEKPTLLHARHININSEGFRSSIPFKFKGTISFFPNGIDDEFIGWKQNIPITDSEKIVCYAGNIGEGQGLDKIIPPLAKILEKTHRFIIIGEGSSKYKLQEKIRQLRLTNVDLLSAIKRTELLEYYKNSHYLFLHLNDYISFEKVLPSKIFEYACGDLPIMAGVRGYSREFMKAELGETVFLFDPCDVNEAVNFLKFSPYQKFDRKDFVEKFKRSKIVTEMSDSIIHCMNQSDEES